MSRFTQHIEQFVTRNLPCHGEKETFARSFRLHRTLLVGEGGVPLEHFFRTPTDALVAG